jgi:hypothetical protein
MSTTFPCQLLPPCHHRMHERPGDNKAVAAPHSGQAGLRLETSQLYGIGKTTPNTTLMPRAFEARQDQLI